MSEFNISMNWREAWYFFFKKKTCPKCEGPLERKISTKDDGFGWEDDGLDFEYKRRSASTVAYACRRCKKSYPLAKLAAKGPA